tara:strand:+ start:250 stop:1749 length:1500 start_codon:yes stop_codon:yes gene_type:complete
MAIKRYFASIDNTLTNAFKANLTTRGTGSNMGASDILEAFVIHGQTSASVDATNAGQSRILIQFPMDQITTDIAAGTLPSSSAQYRLVMTNAPHGGTTPLSYSLDIMMVSQSWSEGRGLDMDNYTDLGYSNWIYGASATQWVTPGGNYLTKNTPGQSAGINYSASYFFSGGTENLNVDVSHLVDRWRSGANPNYGFMIKNTDTDITGTTGTFYTKKFFGRTSEFYLNRPVLEVRWDSSRKDNRGNFLMSSSLLPAVDNLNTLYLYNSVRGELTNIPGLIDDRLRMTLYTGSSGSPTGDSLAVLDSVGASEHYVTAGLLVENGITRTGIYTASFATTSSASTLFDVWITGSTQFHTGSFVPETYGATNIIYNDQYITDITNLKSSYFKGQKPQMRVFIRKKDWSPNIYTVAQATVPAEIINSGYYRVLRTIDNEDIISYGTGSYNATKMSYDVSGNYFELDTSFLDAGYSYGIKFAYYKQGQYREQPEVFKFRVTDEESP